MTPDQFVYWLQGFAELKDGGPPSPEQWKSIVEHLNTVFEKITPEVKKPESKSTRSAQELLQEEITRYRPHEPTRIC